MPLPRLFLIALATTSLAILPLRADDAPDPLAPETPAATDPVSLEKQWGAETLKQIDKDFYNSDSKLYADNIGPDGKKSGSAAMWACGVQLSALAAAAKLDPSYLPRTKSYADGLEAYWVVFKGPLTGTLIGGYNPYPGGGGSDRYYDDNAWIVLNMEEVYELTNDPKYLQKAEDIMKFVMSGEDDKLGGGIYWHEPKLESKNTCINAPAITGLLRLYMLTGKKQHLDDALRLYAWTNAHLQDPKNGLYYDSISVKNAGKIAEFELTYNTALMIRANVLLYQATGDAKYLAEAKRVGQASIKRWVDPETWMMKDAGRFAHLLLDAFDALAEVDPDPVWVTTVDRCVAYVHDKVKDARGRYPEHWDRPDEPPKPGKKIEMIDSSSAARAYWAAAALYRGPSAPAAPADGTAAPAQP